MKLYMFVVSGLFLIACNSGMESDSLKSVERTETEEIVAADDASAFEVIPAAGDTSIDYAEIVSQKLQEYADLRLLIEKYPEFKKELRSQISELSSDSLILQGAGDSVSITDLYQIRPAEIVSDSIRRIPFGYTIHSQNVAYKDSLMAIFTMEKVQVDDVVLSSSKVTFRSLRKK